MSPGIQLGFLLLCFVVADICAVSHEPCWKNKRENEPLSRNDSAPHNREEPLKKGRTRCLACRKLMAKMMPSISRNLKKKLKSACHSFIDFHRPLCMRQAEKFHKSVMDFLYPKQSPIEACRKINMCKKAKMFP